MFKMASQEEMKKEMGTTYLQTAFCGVAKIVGMEKVTGSNGSHSEGIKFNVETEEGQANFQLWYKKKDGTDNEYGIKQLTAIMGITKLNPAKFEIKIEHTTNGHEKEVIKMDKPVECGLYLDDKIETYNGKEIVKHEFKGAFDTKTKKTPAENLNGKESTMYKYWCEVVERKKKTTPKLATQQQETTEIIEDNSDEFPF